MERAAPTRYDGRMGSRVRPIEGPTRRRMFPRARWGPAWLALVLLPGAAIAWVASPLRSSPSNKVEAPSAKPAATAVVAAMPTTPPVVQAAPATSTSCREVAHVGDSTSLGLVSKVLLPNVDDQIGARYRAVGVERFFAEISGARSMVETYKDQPNATEIVKRRRAKGYGGCYVMALGTNDPANTGGNVAELSARIDAMMAQVGDTPVLWTTTKTLKKKGPYQNANMAGWNQALTEACARYSNMRVYDWASEVHDEWFTADGIHFNGVGYRERAARIATALVRAFPKDQAPASECLVHATE